MSNIFCLWSGGLDSSYMIDQLLREGNDVVAGYCDINGGTSQHDREDFARHEMVKKFHTMYGDGRFKYIDKAFEFGIHSVNHEFPIKQAFIWLMSYISIPHDSNRSIDSVAIGYTMNDDALSYIDELKAAWNTFNSFSRKKVDLIFPLLKCKKSDMWESCSPLIKEHVTWCENGMFEDFCGHCASCKRIKYEVPEIDILTSSYKKNRHLEDNEKYKSYLDILKVKITEVEEYDSNPIQMDFEF